MLGPFRGQPCPAVIELFETAAALRGLRDQLKRVPLRFRHLAGKRLPLVLVRIQRRLGLGDQGFPLAQRLMGIIRVLLSSRHPLGSNFGLQGELGQLCLELVPLPRDQSLALLPHRQVALHFLHLLVELPALVAPRCQVLPQLRLPGAQVRDPPIQGIQRLALAVNPVLAAIQRITRAAQIPLLVPPAEPIPGAQQPLQLVGEQPVMARPFRLPLQAAQPRRDLVDYVIHAQQIGARLFQAGQRLGPL